MRLLQRTTPHGTPRLGGCVSMFLPVIRGHSGPEHSKHLNNNDMKWPDGLPWLQEQKVRVGVC